MATDIGEKEREFIEGLKENTGRDLGEWMQAISAAGLPHRDDIIGWLRQEGLMFSKASWLERIHHNGGRAIYAGVPKDSVPRRPPHRLREVRPFPAPAARLAKPAAAPAREAPALSIVPNSPIATVPSELVPIAAAAPPPAASPGDLDALLAKAKAYRPLAQLVVTKIRQASPAASLDVRESAVAFGAPAFAVLGISAKELRLHLALGDQPFDEALKRGQAGGGLGKGETLSHMLVLNDARQVDARFMELVALAADRAHS